MKLAGILIVALTLGGCAVSSFVDAPTVNITPPTPTKMIMRPIVFDVIIVDGEPLITMTPKYYENLALNMQELKRYIKEHQALIQYYKDRE